MRKHVSIGAAAALAAALTYRMVLSGLYFDGASPILVATERLWSYAHGWPPMSHIRDFGWFCAPAVRLICPLIGFLLFRMCARHKTAIAFWKPMAIVVLLALVPGLTPPPPVYAVPWVEAARTFLVVGLISSLRSPRFPPVPVLPPEPALL